MAQWSLRVAMARRVASTVRSADSSADAKKLLIDTIMFASRGEFHLGTLKIVFYCESLPLI
jgi:hypothetical protein